jgi:2-phosphosulfolactate phosphatase
LAEFLKLGEGIPVVVDVLRASSTIVTALANGVTEIIPVNSRKEAFKLKKRGYLIAGEQNGIKLDGFDIGNSPTELLQLLRKRHQEKLALKTTNATRLLSSFAIAYVVSTLNLETAKTELQGKRVSPIAVGSRYGFTEDLAVVLALYSSLNGLEIGHQWVKESVLNSKAAEHLREIGYAKDVKFIANASYDILPKLEAGIIKDEMQT